MAQKITEMCIRDSLRVLLNHGKIVHHLACKGAVWEIPHIQNIFQADQILSLIHI